MVKKLTVLSLLLPGALAFWTVIIGMFLSWRATAFDFRLLFVAILMYSAGMYYKDKWKIDV